MSKRPTRRERLQLAADFVGQSKRNGASAKSIIAGLLARHSGSHKASPSTNVLRVAGTSASCTWSNDEGLLEAWTKLATIHLMRLDGRCG